MRRNRILASLVAIVLAALSIGTATAWFSDSETMRFEITAAGHFDNEGGKVWVCKLVGPPDDLRVKPGKNPIHVSVNSLDANEGFSDAHPSYVVAHGDVVCEVPATPAPDEAVAPIAPTPTTEIQPKPSESTTTTLREETTTTADTTTTTTEQVVTTTVPEEPQSTTQTVPDNDD